MPLQQLVAAVRTVLEQTPPELSRDIIDKGMVMSGGGALLRNIDKLLTQVTGVPCHVAENTPQLRRPRHRPRARALRLLQEVARPADLSERVGRRRSPRPMGRVRRPALPHVGALRLASQSPPCVVRAAATRGLTHLAITDHDRIDGALRARDAAPDGLDGHRRRGDQDRRRRPDRAVPRARIPPGLPAARDVAAVRDAGWARRHPAPVRPVPRLDAQGPRARELAAAVDWVEAWNARVVGGRATSGPRRSRVEHGPAGRGRVRRAQRHRGRRRVHRPLGRSRDPEGLLAALRNVGSCRAGHRISSGPSRRWPSSSTAPGATGACPSRPTARAPSHE